MHRNNNWEGSIITRKQILCYILVMIIVFCGLPSYAAAEVEENLADKLGHGINDFTAPAPEIEDRPDEGTDLFENSVSEGQPSMEKKKVICASWTASRVSMQ